MIGITRKVSPSINHCELTHLERQRIDLDVANMQGPKSRPIGVDDGQQVISLPAEPDLPDSVFVEDIAIVLNEIAILTNPGAVSRRPEVESISNALNPFRELVSIQAPGILDGGDILVMGNAIFVGISSRSNQTATQQLNEIVNPFGYQVKGISVEGCLHLKSAVTKVAEDTLLINPNWVSKDHFQEYKMIEIDPTEMNGANALQIFSTVIYQPCYPRTAEKLMNTGIKVEMVDASELGKAEGALSCCSLIFNQ